MSKKYTISRLKLLKIRQCKMEMAELKYRRENLLKQKMSEVRCEQNS